MQTRCVVLAPVLLDHDLRLRATAEPLPVEALIPQSAVKALEQSGGEKLLSVEGSDCEPLRT